jgi:CheY-like chemotaxis protein
MSKHTSLAPAHLMTPTWPPSRLARVLVVDDDLETIQALAVLLKALGHEAQFAITGLGAINCARKFQPDIVILDVHLPDVEGDKVARLIRFEPGLANVRIIAISADDRTKTRALQAGCEAFHLKPVNSTVVQRWLRS